ncbi:l-asparaginase archaeal glu-trnagln amidotransferase subunit d [Stylonychia lemnae]|uniref:asparaginase n=1 Tax=Stylonychia lemnae TaxID=5949 RepID=A0A078ANR1_STYLE|nr:l-asparaginase archaeal glu-trnagln amidotransferase subunit d [Stylonychia lemnae]|eukprot:CDW83985.1 l-asparaginase archaeal glu-trnagln amidotransferase subunit d [Stylonychia lemnae]
MISQDKTVAQQNENNSEEQDGNAERNLSATLSNEKSKKYYDFDNPVKGSVPMKGNLMINYRNYQLRKVNKNIVNKDITNVLVICTGGTFCMVKTPRGYMVQRGLIERLKMYHCFHDTEYAMTAQLKSDELITPVTPFEKRVKYTMLEFEDLIDSSNMMISDWVKISKTIEHNYKKYDGFVILHGTDTMAYTASALSFMLENLKKPVVVTGSQIPLLEMKNDAIDNLLGSLIVAGHFEIPEVVIFFSNTLMRGNRTQKESTTEMSAFCSPNFKPLGVMGVTFEISWDHIERSVYDGQMVVFTEMSNNISLISMSPLFNLNIIESILEKSEGVIIQAYGMGNIPNKSKELMELLRLAIEKNVIVVILTQCHKGGVNDLYEAGRSLTELGAVLGQDMTLECCYAKLSYLLGKGYSTEKIKKMLIKSMRGELTDIKRDKKVFSLKNSNLVSAIARVIKNEEAGDYKQIFKTIEPVLLNSIAASLVQKDTQKQSNSQLKRVNLDQIITLIDINLDKIDSTGCSPLYHAIRKGYSDIALLLYFKGASVHTLPEKMAKLLCISGFKGDTEKVKLLNQCEADIETSDYDLRTVGHLAAAEGHTELLLYLIHDTEFNFNLKDRWGKKPLDEINDIGIRSQFNNALKNRVTKRKRGKSQEREELHRVVTTNFKTGELESNILDNLQDEQKEEIIHHVNQVKIGVKKLDKRE